MSLDPKKVIAKFKRGEVTLNCGEVFDLVIEHSIKVAKCDDYTDPEKDQMAKGLMREWRTKAQSQCDSIGNTCPYPEPTSTEELKNSCENNVWTVRWSVKTRCTA